MMANTKTRIAGLGLLLTIAIAACGDPLHQGDYQGDPLFTLQGTIYIEEGVSSNVNARIALLWLGDRNRGIFDYGVARSSFPSRYELTIFNEPYSRALRGMPDSDARYAVARIVLYDDSNANGRIDVSERLIGGSSDRLVAFFSKDGESEVVGGSFRQGYQILNIAGTCDTARAPGGALISLGDTRLVDLVVASDVATTLPELECTDLPNDFCLELLRQLEDGSENDQELQALYQSECIENDSSDGERNDEANQDIPCDGVRPGDPDIDQFCVDERYSYCREYLYDYDGANGGGGDALFEFGSCMGELDLCHDVFVTFEEDRNQSNDSYALCLMERYPDIPDRIGSDVDPYNSTTNNRATNAENGDDPGSLSCQELWDAINNPDNQGTDLDPYQREYEERCN